MTVIIVLFDFGVQLFVTSCEQVIAPFIVASANA